MSKRVPFVQETNC